MMIAFWDTAPCGLVEVDRRFTGAYCHHQNDIVFSVGTVPFVIAFNPNNRVVKSF
jgi:hypothetical protein